VSDILIEAGRVVALWRYPVKSMAGDAVSEADVSWHGLAGDRRWAFVREGQERSGFPWLTQRRRPDLCRYFPSFAEPDRPDAARTLVRTPSGDEFDVADPALAASLGEGVRVMKQNRGVFDAMPLSVITTQTVAALGSRCGFELDVRRFRPNVVVSAASGEPFAEDGWVGHVLCLGGMRMRVDARDKRCAVVNVDPATGHRDPAVLRTITRDRDVLAGVYGSTVQPGHITVGDPVVLARSS
jgi:uncharacterized protein YcbX